VLSRMKKPEDAPTSRQAAELASTAGLD
jgi:hypothetical protein